MIGGKTSIGGRKTNQDALLLLEEKGVFVIADGAGGHNAGEVASGMVVAGVAKYIEENPLSVGSEQPAIQKYFSDMIQTINKCVYEESIKYDGCDKMATTMIVVYIDKKDSCAYAFNIGDSRVYVMKSQEQELIQITEDHTFVNELVKRGEMTKDKIAEHPMHHVITRAIGGQNAVKIDVHKVKYKPGDIFMLCTDGLYNEVTDEEIFEIVTENKTMQEVAEKLVETANIKKSHDNITAICVKL